MSIAGLCQIFSLKEPERNYALAFCRKNLEILKQCLAVLGVDEMIGKQQKKNSSEGGRCKTISTEERSYQEKNDYGCILVCTKSE
ncbi:unnamed protein product [Microthlaspi erraticum]|uniref:Uncharacterized protein n=1 Tax=Microthlaspi erraticum TaxID=1685480 RepID=A0A6D2L173_9BRAS|nr:unnamed protein product [Microthlaspi erraticum]